MVAMRDPARIPLVLSAVERAWRKNPDLRLCQFLSSLIYNLSPIVARPSAVADVEDFFVEDDHLLLALAQYYEIELIGEEEAFVREEPARRITEFAEARRAEER